jgi:hypothetical protein
MAKRSKLRKTKAPREISRLIAQHGHPQYPKPRYEIHECLILLAITRKVFYERVREGKYSMTKDGGRSYMTHAQLLAAAEGDNAMAAA